MEKMRSTRPPSLRFIAIEDGIFLSQEDGFCGTIKMRPEDFVVNEIDPSGARVDVSSFIAPQSPSTTPHSTLTSTTTTTGDKAVSSTRSTGKHIASAGQGAPAKDHANQDSETVNKRKIDVVDEVKTVEEVYGPSEQLRLLVGSEGLARLAAINSAAKGCATTTSSVDTTLPEREHPDASTAASNRDRINGCGVPNTEAEASDKKSEDERKSLTAGAGLEPGCVRITGGHLADKAKRAKVHRAVQLAFPFVKTTTDRGPGDAVTVVCTRSEPHPALRELLSKSDLEALQRLVNRGPNAHEAGEGVALVCDPDREHRTRVHRAVSQAHPYLQTKTEPDPRQGNALTVFISWKKRLGGAKRKRQRSASVDSNDSETRRENGRGQEAMDKVNDFVRFALRKEEREHHRVAAALSKVLRVPLSALSFAGMKDKMAITTQACVVRGVPPNKILASNGSIAGVTVGSLSFCHGPLSVGELSGNRFSVTIRGVGAPGAVVERAVREASLTGFINFFGTQRVGSPSAAVQGMPLPYQIGKDMLAGEWEAAAKKVLFPRDNDSPAVREALTDLRDGKIGPKECLRRVKGRNRLFQENAILQGLARFGDSAYREAFQRVPYAMRTLWVRAYQSHVWNSMASERIRLLGPRAAPGDLILLPDCSNAHDGNRAEMSGCAVVKEMTDVWRHGVPGSGVKEVVMVLTKEKMDSLALEGVTAEELLRRVVLPLPGRSVQYPSHQIGDLYKRRLDQDRVNPLMWCHPDAEKLVVSMGLEDSMASPALTMDGSCTVPGQIFSNSPVPESAPPLVVSGDAVGSSIGMVDFVGTAVRPRGAYRRLLCFPDDVCWEETALWGRPDRVICQCRRGDGEVAEVRAAVGVAEAEADEACRIGHGHGRVEDVVISFTLPAGSFATMFLREVMKSDHDIVWGGLKEEEVEED